MDISKLDGPIPGESLTKSPGSSPWEKPTQFVDLNDALEYFWGKLNQPDRAVEMYAMLKSKIPIEALARTILFTAFTQGIITVDMALLAFPIVVKQIAAIGKYMGVSGMVIKSPNPKKDKYLASLGKLMQESKQEPAMPEGKKEAIFSGLGA